MSTPSLSLVPGGQQQPEKKIDPYPFESAFERSVVHYSVSDPRFFGRIGQELEAGAFRDVNSQVVMGIVLEIAKDTGRGPESAVQILQRIRRRVDEGRAAMEDITRVSDFLEDCAMSVGGMSAQAVLDELAPVIKRRLERLAMTEGTSAYAKKADLGVVEDLIRRARRVGQVDTSTGVRLGTDSFGRIEQLRQIQRLPTGIPELDMELNGGLARGAVGVVASGTGGGKSMTMNQIVSHAMVHGLFVGVATLELPEEEWEARVIANLTGRSIDGIMQGGVDAQPAQAALAEMLPKLGVLSTKYFAPKATTLDTLKEWVRTESGLVGRPMDLLIIDYADKLKGPSASDRRKKDEQKDPMEEVFEDMRHYAYVEKGVGWIWTASQIKNKNMRKSSKADADDLAGSSEKARASSLIVIVSHTDDGSGVEYFVAKHTQGKARFKVGPFPHDEACGRIYSGVHRE